MAGTSDLPLLVLGSRGTKLDIMIQTLRVGAER